MADFFSGSLQSRAARGNFQSMMGSPAYESRYISFDEFIRSKGPEAAMRARDPIAFRGLWSEYSNRYPQSARIAVTQDAFRQMGGESPVEQGIRQSRDYKDYMREMKAAGAEEFMLTPQSFAASDVRKREKGRETMQEFYKGAGTGKPVGDMSPDVPFKKKGAEAMVKVPVGPGGELQIERAGRDSTKFRMLPKSEVERMIMEKRKEVVAAGQQDISEMKLEEARKMQQAEPALMEQTARLRGFEESEKLRGESEKVRNERSKLDAILRQNPGILQNPEYSSLISDAYSSVNAGVPAEMAARDLVGTGKLPEIKEKRQRERERLREAARSDLARIERDFKIDYYQWKAGQDQAIRDAQSSGDRQAVAMRAQAAYDDLRAHTGALQRGIDALRVKISRAKDENEKLDIESQVSTLQSELDDARQSMSYYMSIRNATPPAPVQVPALSGFGGKSQPPATASAVSGYVTVRLSDGRQVSVRNTPEFLNAIRQRDPGAQIIGSM